MGSIDYFDVRVYRYGDKYKVNYLKRFIADSYYVPDDDISDDDDKESCKLVNNLCRAKSNVLALGMCNPWQYFVTFTLNRLKYDRGDLDSWHKDFSQYIRDQRKKGFQIQYLLIPELHSDGRSWHMHGFISGIPWDKLEPFIPGKHPQRLIDGDYRYHNGIRDKFGFNSFGRLRSVEAATKYALKYITKSMAARKDELGAHLYYCSRGLARPELVLEGAVTSYLSKIEFENEFMASGWLDPFQFPYLSRSLL